MTVMNLLSTTQWIITLIGGAQTTTGTNMKTNDSNDGDNNNNKNAVAFVSSNSLFFFQIDYWINPITHDYNC